MADPNPFAVIHSGWKYCRAHRVVFSASHSRRYNHASVAPFELEWTISRARSASCYNVPLTSVKNNVCVCFCASLLADNSLPMLSEFFARWWKRSALSTLFFFVSKMTLLGFLRITRKNSYEKKVWFEKLERLSMSWLNCWLTEKYTCFVNILYK